MKYPFLSVAFLLFPLLCFSQGITFEKGSWSEVLDKAKQTNKPVFVDVYADWCGPCKTMSKEIFPLESVGEVYNAAFINYQVDAEKGEGIELASKYNVTAYPTYIFVKPDGTLFSRGLGSMGAAEFIKVAQKALKELNDPKPLPVWEAEYPTMKNDPAFLLDYLTKRSSLGLPINDLFNEYLQLLPATERISEHVAAVYSKDGGSLSVSDFSYQHLLKNRKEFSVLLLGVVDGILQDGVLNTMKEAARTNNEALFQTAMAAFDQIPASAAIHNREEIFMEYYRRTKAPESYLKYAILYCNNNLMMVEPSSNAMKVRAEKQVLDYLKGMGVDPAQMDNAKLEEVKTSMEAYERDRISSGLNSAAWTVFELDTDVAVLQDALRWSDRSLQFDPKNTSFMDTKANILYKLGKKEEAIALEKQAIASFPTRENAQVKELEETVRKMEAGEKTW